MFVHEKLTEIVPYISSWFHPGSAKAQEPERVKADMKHFSGAYKFGINMYIFTGHEAQRYL
jgi:hypothetical protein